MPSSKPSSLILSVIPSFNNISQSCQEDGPASQEVKVTHHIETFLAEDDVDSTNLEDVPAALILVDTMAIVHRLLSRGDGWHQGCEIVAEPIHTSFVDLKEPVSLSFLWKGNPNEWPCQRMADLKRRSLTGRRPARS